MLCGATQDGPVRVERSDSKWSIGEGNGKPFQYSCLGNPMNSMKRQKDRTLIVREIKNAIRHHLTLVRMAIIKNLQTINAVEGVEKMGTQFHC